MICFGLSDASCRDLVAARKIWSPRRQIVGIRRNDVHKPLIKHSLRPVTGPATERTVDRPSRQLHPDAAQDQCPHQIVSVLDPGQSLRVRQDRKIPFDHEREKKLFQSLRRDVMGWLDKDITRIPEREEVPALEAFDEVADHMIVGSAQQGERDARLVDMPLQVSDAGDDIRSAVVIDAGQYVRCARDMSDALIREHPRHLDGLSHIGGAVINARQEMTVKVNYRTFR